MTWIKKIFRRQRDRDGDKLLGHMIVNEWYTVAFLHRETRLSLARVYIALARLERLPEGDPRRVIPRWRRSGGWPDERRYEVQGQIREYCSPGSP